MKIFSKLHYIISTIVVVMLLLTLYTWWQPKELSSQISQTPPLGSQHIKHTNYGVLTLTEYGKYTMVKGDFSAIERGARVTKQTLCSQISSFCIDDERIQVSESPGKIITAYTQTNKKHYLFNRVSGSLVSCLNCQSESDFHQVLNAQFHWSTDGNQAIVVNSSHWINKQFGQLHPVPGADKHYNEKPYNIWQLDFLPSGVNVFEIPPTKTNYESGEPLNLTYSPDNKFIAWHLCNPDCKLWRYNITHKTYSSVAYPCSSKQYNNLWQITWKDNTPSTEYNWTIQEKGKCFKADGTPAFPTQKTP